MSNYLDRIAELTPEKRALLALRLKQNQKRASANKKRNEGPHTPPRNAQEKLIVEWWQEALGLERVGVFDNFFELGGDLTTAEALVERFRAEFGESVPARVLAVAPTPADLSAYLVEYYPDVASKMGPSELENVDTMPSALSNIELDARVDEASVRKMREIIPPLRQRADDEELTAKNRPAIFILSPPRSGSTLLRAILAGHPRLFAPPELDLLSFNTLRERREAFSGKQAFWLEGVIRAIMEVKRCDAEEADAMMREFERNGLSVKKFYALLQDWIGDRTLVDKTPVYSLSLDILQRAETDFERPFYIHLVRHPYATIYSFIEARLDHVFFRYEHPFSRRQLAELIWIVSHQNILEFLHGIPSERRYRLSFEELVKEPHNVVRSLCRALGIDYVEQMTQPYDGARMTDAVRPGSQMVGDFKFYLRNRIDPRAATRWKRFHRAEFLGAPAWQLAECLGYHRRTGYAENPTMETDASEQPIHRA